MVWRTQMKGYKQYDITQCVLYMCQTRKKLAKHLKLDYNRMMSRKFISYYTFKERKKNSTEMRTITAPCDELKKIQRRVLFLLQSIIRPRWLMSSAKGKSYIDNGKFHINAKYALTMDIEKFYDKCTREYVYRFFIEKLKIVPDVANILTDIVTYGGKIPTGSPSSQVLAYYAYEDMFLELERSAVVLGCNFTLLVDDITTSSETPFNKDRLSSTVTRIMNKYGHSPKLEKTQYYAKDKPKPITGTIITTENKLGVPKRLQSEIYKSFQKLKSIEGAQNYDIEFSSELASLSGKIQAAVNIDPKIFPEISRMVKQWQSVSTKLNV